MDIGDWIAVSSAVMALSALMISAWSYILTRQHLLLERVHKLSDRLYEMDKLIIEYPDLQRILYEESKRKQPYFVEETLHSDDYFRLKTFIYSHLNMYDELFSVVEGDKKLETVFEFDDWKGYIIKRMRHPLFKELFDRESSIWGGKFRGFIEKNRIQILESHDPEIY